MEESIARTVAAMRRSRISAIFFDLDYTLTRRHTWHELGIQTLKDAETVEPSVLRAIAIMPEHMSRLILALQRAGIVVGICTDQYEALALKFIRAAYSEAVYDSLKRYVVGRDRRDAIERSGPGKVGRMLHLIATRFQKCLLPDHVCLVDDDEQNIAVASRLFWTKLVPSGRMNPVADLQQPCPPRIQACSPDRSPEKPRTALRSSCPGILRGKNG